MRNIESLKNIFVTFGLLFISGLQAKDNSLRDSESRLVSARDIGGGVAELSFDIASTNSEGALVRRKISVKDDDGLLTLAALNLNLTQNITARLARIGQDNASGDFHGNVSLDPNSVRSALAEWDQMKNLELKKFPAFKQSILNALMKLADYNLSLLRTNDSIETRQELAEVNRIYNELKDKETLSPMELSLTLSDLIAKFGKSHMYNATESGKEMNPLRLIDEDLNNPLGYLFKSTPAQLADYARGFNHSVFDTTMFRSPLDVPQEVLVQLEKSSQLPEQASDPEGRHRNLPSLEDDLVIPGQP